MRLWRLARRFLGGSRRGAAIHLRLTLLTISWTIERLTRPLHFSSTRFHGLLAVLCIVKARTHTLSLSRPMRLLSLFGWFVFYCARIKTAKHETKAAELGFRRILHIYFSYY